MTGIHDNNEPELEEVLTATEEKFESLRKSIGLFLGPLAGTLIYFLPLHGLNPQAHILLAIVFWTVIWWITEPIPIPMTAVLSATLSVISGVGDARQVFAPFADPLIFLFIGSFIIAKAMSVHHLDKRFAYGIMSLKSVGSSSARILFAFGAISAFLSMWISNTATTAMMYPIAIGIVTSMVEIYEKRKGREINPLKLKFATAMMLMTAYASSAGGIGMPVGSPPNLIGIAMIDKFAGVKISFFQWMSFAVPLLIVMYVLLFFILYFLNKPEIKKITEGKKYIQAEEKKIRNWSRGEINTLFAFVITVFLWLLPGFVSLTFGSESPPAKFLSKYLPETTSAIIGASLLFMLPVSWKKKVFTIKWKDAVTIDWGTLLLFGGGLSLGNLMFETKLAESIGNTFLNITGSESLWGLTLAAIFISIFVSEVTSNTASANMVIPLIISVCIAAGINPVPPAIGATLGASWGFMLPVSTPPNAIVYGSGMIPVTRMIKAGFIFDILGGLLIWIGLRILLPLINFA